MELIYVVSVVLGLILLKIKGQDLTLTFSNLKVNFSIELENKNVQNFV